MATTQNSGDISIPSLCKVTKKSVLMYTSRVNSSNSGINLSYQGLESINVVDETKNVSDIVTATFRFKSTHSNGSSRTVKCVFRLNAETENVQVHGNNVPSKQFSMSRVSWTDDQFSQSVTSYQQQHGLSKDEQARVGEDIQQVIDTK